MALDFNNHVITNQPLDNSMTQANVGDTTPNPSPAPSGPPPGAPSGAGPAGGGFNLGDIFGGLNLTDLFAGGAQALQQWQNAGDIQKGAERYATQLDPYGPYRKSAADQIAALWADPSRIEQTPGYQFAKSQGLGAVAARDNPRVGVGAGTTSADMETFASGLASKTYNDTLNQLMQQAGVQFGPQSAAGMLQTGLLGSVNSRNAALAALFGGLGKSGTNQGGGAGPDVIGNIIRGLTGGSKGLDPATMARLAQMFPGIFGPGASGPLPPIPQPDPIADPNPWQPPPIDYQPPDGPPIDSLPPPGDILPISDWQPPDLSGIDLGQYF